MRKCLESPKNLEPGFILKVGSESVAPPSWSVDKSKENIVYKLPWNLIISNSCQFLKVMVIGEFMKLHYYIFSVTVWGCGDC